MTVQITAGELGLPFAVPLAENVPAAGPDPVPEFATTDSARRALVIHAVAAHQLADERPVLLLAARAAGLDDATIQDITGVSGAEINALPARCSAPVVDPAARNRYAVLLYRRGMIIAADAALVTDAQQRDYLSGYVDAVYQEAASLRAGGQAEPFGDMLLSRVTQLRAYQVLLRDEGADDDFDAWRKLGWFDATGRIAAELALVRSEGIDALDRLFSAHELAVLQPRPAGGPDDVAEDEYTIDAAA